MNQQQSVDALLMEAIRCYEQGDLESAEHLCHEALLENPKESAALHLNGLIANDRGDSGTAARWLEQAVCADPTDSEAWNDFGNALHQSGRVPEAQSAFGQAVHLQPDFADAHSNFGFMLFRQGAYADSLDHFRRAIAIDPEFALAYNNLACALLEMQQSDEAIGVLRAAIARSPLCVDSYVNLGHALRRCDRPSDAIEILQRGWELSPQHAAIQLNLGGAYKDLGEYDNAQAAYERALCIQPTYAEAHWNLALVLLARGEFGRGWEEFEWRRRVQEVAPVMFPHDSREWTGQVMTGKTILLVAEQGLGDTLQFIRYGSLLKQAGARVLAAVHSELLSLLAGCNAVDEFVALRPPFPLHDLSCFLMSLPRLLSPCIESFPNQVPYLRADERLVATWREELAAISGFKVGIAWQGNPKYPGDRHRSIPLRYFEPLANVPGVCLVSLQRGHGTEQVAPLSDRWPLLELGSERDQYGAFTDTAAVIRNLDLVISSDTALVHLAGALGVPVWMPTSFVPDWRWLLNRGDSPWYPTLRLFRQVQRMNWETVFDEMTHVLRGCVESNRAYRY